MTTPVCNPKGSHLDILKLEPGVYFTRKLAIQFNVSRTTIVKWLRECGDSVRVSGEGRNARWYVKENSLNLHLVTTCPECYEHIPISRFERHKRLCKIEPDPLDEED